MVCRLLGEVSVGVCWFLEDTVFGAGVKPKRMGNRSSCRGAPEEVEEPINNENDHKANCHAFRRSCHVDPGLIPPERPFVVWTPFYGGQDPQHECLNGG